MGQDDYPEFDDLNFDEEDFFGPESEEEEEALQFEETGERRSNRSFLIGVAVLAGIFIVALIVVGLIILTRPTGPSPNDLTNTAIAVAQAETAAAEALTATAESWTDTPTPTFTPSLTPSPTPTETPSPPPSPTETPTEVAMVATTEPPPTATPTPTEAPVEGAALSGGEPLETGTGGPLPSTGIGDRLGLGAGLLLAGLGAVGLLSVVFLARRMRTRG